MSFDVSNLVPVDANENGNTAIKDYKVDNLVPVDVSKQKQTAFQRFQEFRESEKETIAMSQQAAGGLEKGRGNVAEDQFNHEFPPTDFLHAAVNVAGDTIYSTFAPALGLAPEARDKANQEMAELERDHPIAAIVGGTAPFIATAPLFPGSLAGMTAQFATISGLSELGRQRAEESLTKPVLDKAFDVARETSKGALMGPIWHYSAGLNFIGRPFASALARAGVRAAGTTTLDKFYGDNLTQAFKDGGIMAALSLMFETTSLGKTALGRGLANRTNDLWARTSVLKGLPSMKMDPDLQIMQDYPVVQEGLKPTGINMGMNKVYVKEISDLLSASDSPGYVVKNDDGSSIRLGTGWPTFLANRGYDRQELNNIFDKFLKDQELTDKQKATLNQVLEDAKPFTEGLNTFQKQVLTMVSGLAHDVPGADKPQIQAAAIRMLDGDGEFSDASQVIEGASHEHALNKIDQSKDTFEEGKDFQAGFIDSQGKFISRQQSMEEPYNLPNGSSSDVPGLNEQAWVEHPEPPKPTNAQTLSLIPEGEEGKMDVSMIPGVPEVAENLKRAYEEMVKTFVPPDVSDPATFTAMTMREWLGVNARNRDRFMNSMHAAYKIFDKASKESIIDTYTRAERGEAQDSPELRTIYDTLQNVLLDKAQEVQRETGRLQDLIENYLPHIWENPRTAKEKLNEAYNATLGRIFGKRPLGGKKSFLKMRKINDFETGVKLGLTPVSWNPVELTLMKLTEMDRFLMEHRVRNALRARDFEYFLPVGEKRREGTEDWIKVNDPASDVYKSPMIPIKEAFDQKVMDKLNAMAKSLDIEHLRKVNIGGKRWGYAARSGEKVVTKFAGDPGIVLSHELGHAIDFKYGLQEMMFGGKRPLADFIMKRMIAKAEREGRTEDVKRMTDQMERNKEMRDLADATEGKRSYVRKGVEKMAIMMESLINAPDVFKEVAPKTYKMFTDFLASKPELKGFLDIKPSTVLGEGSAEVYAGGNVIAGQWLTHPDAARILNNYLTPGLRGKYFYDIWRSAGNSLVQARLSLSAFHGQFVSNDANISHFALGLQKLANGDLKGFQNVGLSMAPGLPIINPGAIQTFMEGRKMMEAWNGKDNGATTNLMAEFYARGGGRAKMDRFYAIEADKAIAKALKEGKLLTGALYTPFWLLQQANRPLLEYYVPIMKMGVFSNMLKYEIERNPNITNAELLVKANKAVDAVDDRMGQLVYDNLFISRTLKDLGMASVQSLGWNIGDVRLFGGGAVDALKGLNELRQGKAKASDMSYRVAYVLAMPMVIGWYGAIYQYLHTGKYPGQGIEDQGFGGVLKDLYFPRNGGFDPNGQESRSSLASYVKDIYHFAVDPVRTVIDKLNPLGSSVLNQFQNRNFYGVQIVDPNDPPMKQFLDRVSDAVSENFPYSIQNAQRNPNRSFENKAENFFGFNIAPYDLNMTRAEREAHKMAAQEIPIAPRTKEAAQQSQNVAQLRSQYLQLKDKDQLAASDLLEDAVTDRKITDRQKKQIEREAKENNLQRLTRNLRYDQVYYLLRFANDQEKDELLDILAKKETNLKKRKSWTEEDEKLLEEQTAAR
jgi:hypothetical protein